jgi:hypothetical protein
VALRAASGGLLKDLKEVLFVGPLIAICTAVAVCEIAARGRPGRRAAVMITVGLLAFGTERYLSYVHDAAAELSTGRAVAERDR